MGLYINKNGIISTSNFIEQEQFGNSKISFFKNTNKNIASGVLDVVTNKNGTVKEINTLVSIPADTIISLAGKTLCCSYDVSCLGARLSTEQGQTDWHYTRYGLHGGLVVNSQTTYPFASYLNYSGGATRVVMTYTLPSTITTSEDLYLHLQNFDKPASTNNEIWFLRNFKVEVSSYATPFVVKDATIAEGNCVQAKEIIEI